MDSKLFTNMQTAAVGPAVDYVYLRIILVDHFSTAANYAVTNRPLRPIPVNSVTIPTYRPTMFYDSELSAIHRQNIYVSDMTCAHQGGHTGRHELTRADTNCPLKFIKHT